MLMALKRNKTHALQPNIHAASRASILWIFCFGIDKKAPILN
jgi:hypothetical protein